MNAPSSRPPDERFAEWVDGCMSQRDRERFEAELRVNAALRTDLAAYERTVAAVREALQAPTAPTNLADRVLSAVQAASPAASSPPGPRKQRSFGTYLFGGLAAAALMAVAVWFDAWVTPAGQFDKVAQIDRVAQVDKVAQVDPAAVGAPPPGTAPVEDLARTGGAADAPAAEQGKESQRPDRLDTDAAKPAEGNAADVEAKKQLDQSREGANGLAKNPGADAKDRGQFGARGEPEPGAVSVAMPDAPAARSQAAGTADSARQAEAQVPPPAAPVVPPPIVPGGAVRGAPEAGESAPAYRDTAAPEAEGKPDAEGDPKPEFKPDAVGGVRELSGAPSTASGEPAGSAVAPPSSEGTPAAGSRGVPSPGRAPASPFAEPLPFLTVERSAPSPNAPSPTVLPPAEVGAKGEELRLRFAEGATELPQLVDRFLATAGAGAGDEIVWRTARGSLVLRAVDPGLLAKPAERDARRAEPTGTGGGGGSPAAPLPMPCAWLVVGDPADIEILLARLGAKVRAEGWRLQTGEFEGPKAPQGQKPKGNAGPGGPGAGSTGAQRSLLLQFRYVR